MDSKNSNSGLSIKDVNTLKKAMACCDKKQFKDGVKLCKKILASHPKHGETLTVMGLLLYLKGTKDEGIQKAKLGLGYDLKNSNSWRIYGMLMQETKQYEKAVSSFKSSIKLDPSQFHLLRDMSRTQAHIRDFVGCKETRLNLVRMKPNLRNCWMGYAVACELSGDLETAIRVMEEFRKAQNEQNMSTEIIDVEYSQIVMYHIDLLLKSDEVSPSRVLTTLCSSERLICDKCFVLETKAKFYALTGSREKCFKSYFELLKRNSEQPRYFQKMAKVLNIDKSYERKLGFYRCMLNLFPSSEALQFLILECAQGEAFLIEFRTFFNRKVTQSVPNIFSLTKNLYSDPSKIFLMEKVVKEFAGGEDKPESRTNSTTSGDASSNKSTIYFYLAHHYYEVGSIPEALVYIHMILSSTPSFVDALLFKAEVLKSVGITDLASSLAAEACSLNKSDRFLNSTSSFYYLCNGQESQSDAIQKSYSKDITIENQLKDLQVLWYMVELATMYASRSDFVSSMKYVNLVYKVFCDFNEDLFDFHGYALRKCTLSSYVSLVKYSSASFKHKFFFSVAKLAIKSFLLAHKPRFGLNSYMPESCRLPSKDAFAEMANIVQKLTLFNLDDYESRELAFLFYVSTGKPLLVLRELIALHRIDPHSLSTAFALVNFWVYASEKIEVLEERILKVCETLWSGTIETFPFKPNPNSQEIVAFINQKLQAVASVLDATAFVNLVLAKKYFLKTEAAVDSEQDDWKLLLSTLSTEKQTRKYLEKLDETTRLFSLLHKHRIISAETFDALKAALQPVLHIRESLRQKKPI